MKVWSDAKPFTKLTRRRAQPGVAKMRLMFFVAEMIPVLITTEILFGSGHALEYYSPLDKNMSSHFVDSSL
jgi:hypothetical protein